MKAIHRNTNFEKLSYAVKRVKENKNIHQHLDLIAGLPWEDLTSFQTSFNEIYQIFEALYGFYQNILFVHNT